MVKEYSLWLFWQQGDELRQFLGENDGDISAALSDMADLMRFNHEICIRLSRLLSGKDISVHASAHHISFEPGNSDAEELLEALVREKLLNKYEQEEEEWGDDDDDDDDDEDEGEP